MSNRLLFSVIIPTCGRPDSLRACLNALEPKMKTDSELSCEVIVSDDQYDEGSAERLLEEFPFISIFEGPRRGPAANRNHAAKQASGKWLVFTDDDCIPDHEWLNSFASAIEMEPLAQVLEGRTYAPGKSSSLADVAPVNEKGGYLWSCNFAIQRELFIRLNGFDERFPTAAMEDVELRYRIQKEGLPIHFISRASVCHPWRRRGNWETLRKKREATLIYLSIHPEQREVLTAWYHLHYAGYGFFKSTLPEVMRGKVKGFNSALLEHFSLVWLAVKLIFSNSSRAR